MALERLTHCRLSEKAAISTLVAALLPEKMLQKLPPSNCGILNFDTMSARSSIFFSAKIFNLSRSFGPTSALKLHI